MKVIGEKLACIDNSRVFIVSDTQKFDQINLSINDISTYQTDKYWIAEGSKGLRSIQRKGSNSFEALNEPIILDGPYSNSAFDIVCKNDKVYMIIGGKALRGNKINYGEFGLVATEPCWIRSNQIEAARVAMTRYIKRGGQVWIKIFPDKPVTAKPDRKSVV